MSAAIRLIGLTRAAAITGNAAALAAAFDGLDAQEAAVLAEAASVDLEARGAVRGDYGPWALLHAEAGRARLQEAGAGFRARLDEAAGTRRAWELRQRRVAVERAEAGIRRAVRPLLRQRASKAEVEEAAGRAAGEVIEWPRIFAILVEEFDLVTSVAGADHG